MKRKDLLKLTALILMTSVLVSCNQALKDLENGNYDQAFFKAHKKLRGKPKKKAKYVAILEDAFHRANAEDMAHINALKRTGAVNKWEKIIHHTDRINSRQSQIRPLLPLASKEGYRPSIEFIETSLIREDAITNLARHYYSEAERWLDSGRTGNKIAARKAHSLLNEIDRYFDSYEQKDSLLDEAISLGTTRVLFQTENHSYGRLPRYMLDEVYNWNFGNSDRDFWKSIDFRPQQNVTYDYEITLYIDDIYLGPERYREEIFDNKKRVEDGSRLMRDKKGNPVLDSLGREIRMPKFADVEARVIKVYQEKKGGLSGEVVISDLRNRSVIKTKRLSKNFDFAKESCTYQGDRRAVEDQYLRITGPPVDFPSDYEIMRKLAEEARCDIERIYKRFDFI